MKDKIEQRDPRNLRHNIDNPRGEIPVTDSLLELSASIKEKGVLQPILITPDDVIIFGHRRTVAAIMADLPTVPVMVDDGNKSRAEQIEVMLIENAQREGLTVMQTARAYEVLHDRDIPIAAIATAIGSNKGTVARYLHILELPSELHPYFDDNKLGLGAVDELLRLPAIARLSVGRRAVAGDWTLKELKRQVDKIVAPPKSKNEKVLEYQVHINAILEGLGRMDELLGRYSYPPLREVKELLLEAAAKLRASHSPSKSQPSKQVATRALASPTVREGTPARSLTSIAAQAVGMREPKWKSTRK